MFSCSIADGPASSSASPKGVEKKILAEGDPWNACAWADGWIPAIGWCDCDNNNDIGLYGSPWVNKAWYNDRPVFPTMFG